MGFSGGVFSRVHNWVNDRLNGINITDTRMDAEFDGMATGLSLCLLKDGTQTASALIPFAHGINIASGAPGAPANGDMWVTTSGLIVRANGQTITLSSLFQTPVGAEMPWGTDTPPTGWLMMYGQNISRSTYASLFALYGTTYGAGDGSTTFTLPDYRGRAPFGKDNMGGSAANRITAGNSGVTGTTLGAVGGSELLHAHNHSQNAHSHSVSDPTHTHSVSDPMHSHPMGRNAVQSGSSVDRVTGPGADTTTTAVATGIGIVAASTGVSIVANTATNNAAGTGASQNMPPAIIRNWIVFTGVA